MNHRQNVEPLIYIEQPVLKPKHAWMQNKFEVVKDKDSPSELNKGRNRDVAFKHLSIADQINYLLTRTEGIPAIHCEVLTNEGKYQGIIFSQTETEIELRVVGRPYQTIFKKDIQRIRLIGF